MTVRALMLCESALVWWWLAEWTALPLLARVALTCGVGAVLAYVQPRVTLALRRRPITGAVPRLATRAYFGFCIACMLAAIALLLVSIPYALGLPAARLWSDASVVWWGDAFHLLSTAAVAMVFALVGYGCTLGQAFVRRPRADVPVPHLPPDLRGLRIVHITDLHLGHHLHGQQLRNYVAAVNALEPDLIALTGDVLDHDPAWIDRSMPDLAALRARYGVYAVLGNHDGYTGTEAVAEGLARHTDFVVLRDEWRPLQVGNATLYLVGLDDPTTHFGQWSTDAFQLDAVIHDLPDDGPVVLLCHRPDVWPQAVKAGIPLTLVGHTHGGQLAVPGTRRFSLARLITPFPSGWYEAEGCRLYVNRGLGVAGSPIRVGAPREIAVHTLQAAPHHALQPETAPQPAEAAIE